MAVELGALGIRVNAYVAQSIALGRVGLPVRYWQRG